MSSIEFARFLQQVVGFPFGIHCSHVVGETMPRIILKLSVSYILPAKIKNGFKIYVVPVDNRGVASVCLMCAFFDDADEPLTLMRHLENDEDSGILRRALARSKVLVHLFDEHNNELLGYRATVLLPPLTKVRLASAKFPPLTHETANSIGEQANEWFSMRKASDDAEAIHIRFEESLYPHDVSIANAIERADPGLHQEQDIVKLLQRVFQPDQIYHSPRRHDDNKEIADVIVITDALVLVVQAKDSPNTEGSMNRLMERKRLAAVKMLKNAISQLSGAVRYIDRTDPLRMVVNGGEKSFNVRKHNVLSLAVVRELFNNDYAEYSEQLFGFFDEVGLPCIALDYPELLRYTTFLKDEEAFVGAYLQVFDKARELRTFPRLRFGINDAKAIFGDGGGVQEDPTRF